MRTVTAYMALLLLGAAGVSAQSPETTRLIVIVGDGAGLGHWSAARMTSTAPLAVEKLPVIGLMDTRCECTRTTDSGAAATAFATGTRTGYRMIGMGPDSLPRTSVLEAAEARGLATGLVTTSHVTDATPAAFGAHVPNRYDREGIAAQYAGADIEVLLGGGLAFFERRRDGRSLLHELRDRYTIVTSRAAFDSLDLARSQKLLGLFADSMAFPDTEPRPTLPQMAKAALTVLDRNARGFFLLLESEDTDELAHGNDTLPRLLAGMRELNATVQVALDYQARHPETLIVVLGDHETGGMTLQLQRGEVVARYGTTDHSAEATLIFAGGPGAGAFGRWLDNAEVGKLLLRHVEGGGAAGTGQEHPLH